MDLKERILWLEDIVRTRCPDVDLSQGPACTGGDQNAISLVDVPSETPHDDQAMPSAVFNPTDPVHDGAAATDSRPHGSRLPLSHSAGGANVLSHEVGLVSLGTSLDPRYIGPSSAYFLARVMLSMPPRQDAAAALPSREATFSEDLVEAVQGPLPLPRKEMAKQLCDAYFESIHPLYPALHEPTFLNMLNKLYGTEDPDPVSAFQVYMVLAIGSMVLSGRLRTRLPGESYCLSAMQFFHRLNIENSLQGLQCLILLTIFTIHSPCVRLNIWYLNYQCIAALLDLGLQRDITTRAEISVLEQEMRTRMFWVVFSLDRTVATMMGRPIGLRDEACELRVSLLSFRQWSLLTNCEQMPLGFEDSALSSSEAPAIMAEGPTPMVYSIHLLRLAKLNSEIKYVANSIVRDAPSYAYPAVIDIHEWQSSMLQKLDQWAAQIPGGEHTSAFYLRLTCQLRYHGLRMVLLRPSPAIPKPSSEALEKCHSSARETIRIFDKLYRRNLLVHSWMSFHGLVLATLTMFYCIKTVPKIEQETDLGALMGDLSTSSSILSATGEHWSGAKRCRDILDDLGRSMIQGMFAGTRRQPLASEARPRRGRSSTINERTSAVASDSNRSFATFPDLGAFSQAPAIDQSTDRDLFEVPIDLFDDFLASGSFANYFDSSASKNMDSIVQNLFDEFGTTNPDLYP